MPRYASKPRMPLSCPLLTMRHLLSCAVCGAQKTLQQQDPRTFDRSVPDELIPFINAHSGQVSMHARICFLSTHHNLPQVAPWHLRSRVSEPSPKQGLFVVHNCMNHSCDNNAETTFRHGDRYRPMLHFDCAALSFPRTDACSMQRRLTPPSPLKQDGDGGGGEGHPAGRGGVHRLYRSQAPAVVRTHASTAAARVPVRVRLSAL